MGFAVDAIVDRQCRSLGPDGRAGVAFFLGAVNILCIACRGEVRLAGLHFGLLHAEKVGIQGVEGILKTLF